AAQVAPAEIIGQDEENVGALRLRGLAGTSDRQEKTGKEASESGHGVASSAANSHGGKSGRLIPEFAMMAFLPHLTGTFENSSAVFQGIVDNSHDSVHC